VRLQKAADDAGVRSDRPPEDCTPLQDLHTTSEGETIGEGSLNEFATQDALAPALRVVERGVRELYPSRGPGASRRDSG